jgi:GGDEF domain-containing protein
MKHTKNYIYLLLVVLAFAATQHPLTLFPGLQFGFASIFLLVALRLYGMIRGMAGAFLIALYLYFFSDNPISGPMLFLEICSVGLYLNWHKNIITADLAFWLLVGGPLAWIFSEYYQNSPQAVTRLLTLKLIVTGLSNALFASVICDHTPLRRWTGILSNQYVPTFQKTMFNLFLMLLLVLSVAIVTFSGRLQIAKMKSDIQLQLSASSSVVSSNISAWLKQHQHAANLIASKAAQTDPDKGDELQEVVAVTARSLPDCLNIYVANSKGITLAYYPETDRNGVPTKGIDFSDMAYFRKARATLKTVMTDLYLEHLTLSPAVGISVPLVRETSHGRAFACMAHVTLSIANLMKLLEVNVRSWDMNATLLDGGGMVIASTRPELPAFTNYGYRFAGFRIPLSVSSYQWLPGGKMEEADRWLRSLYVMELKVGGSMPWTLVVEAPVAPHQAHFYQILNVSLFVILLVQILALCTITVLSHWMMAPLKNVVQVSTNLPAKLLYRQDISWPLTNVFEIQALTVNFKRMLGSLREMFEEQRATNARLEQAVRERTAQLEAEKQKAELLARVDPLTGLANRRAIREALQNDMVAAARYDWPLTLIYYDIDHFKRVNDRFGHNVGDLVIKGVTETISEQIREADRFFEAEDKKFKVTCSFGLAQMMPKVDDVDSLIKRADEALYEAKEGGRDRVFTKVAA